MNELERMEALKALLNDEEVLEFVKCIEVLNLNFRRMIGSVQNRVLESTSSQSEIEMDDASKLFEAVKKISFLASKYGIEFPKISNVSESRLYVVKYGKDVLFS